jgi:hypothetical protein
MRMLHQKLFHFIVKHKTNYFYPFFTVGYPDTYEYNVHGYQTTADTYYSYQDLSPYDSHGVYADTK